MSLVRMGIIGVGFGAQVHLPAFLSLESARVTALADSGSGRARRIAAEAGIPAAFHRWQDLLDIEELDAVSVAVPPDQQAEIVCAALRAGKHVLCEKPLGCHADDAERMLEAARASRRVHAVNYAFRHEPGIARMQRLARQGTIGPIRSAEVSWLTGGRADPSLAWSWQHDRLRGGGVINAFASHAIDYVQWICGARIVAVRSHAATLVPARPCSAGLTRAVTAEDAADVECELEDGRAARIAVSNCARPARGHRIELRGLSGQLVFHHTPPYTPVTAALTCQTDAGPPVPLAVPSLPQPPATDTRVPMFRQLAQCFLAAIRGEAVADLPDFACGVGVRRVLDAVQLSFQQERRVTCPCS